MLTNLQYKSFARDIAEIFCDEQENPPLCITSVKERIISNFTNEMFQQSFLPHLDSARFYAFTILQAPSSQGFIKYNVNGFDIVTGKNKTQMIDGIPGARRNDYAWVYNVHLNAWYGANHPEYHSTYLGKISGKHIVMIQQPNNYGIIFVPQSTGNGGGGGGGGQQNGCPEGQFFFNGQCVDPAHITTGGGQQAPPTMEPIVPSEAGFDFQSLLIPGLIIGAGFYILKQRKLI